MIQSSIEQGRKWLPVAMFALLLATPVVKGQRLSESTGINLFQANCTGCHGETPVEHAPSESAIKTMPPERIYEAITTGAMKNMAAKLS